MTASDASRKQRVLETLQREARPLTVRQIARRTGLNYAETYLAVVELRNEGEITRVAGTIETATRSVEP